MKFHPTRRLPHAYEPGGYRRDYFCDGDEPATTAVPLFGDVELVDITDGVVTLKLTGACGSCPMASLTLKRVVERMLKERVPEVKEVIELQSPKTGVAR